MNYIGEGMEMIAVIQISPVCVIIEAKRKLSG